MPKFSKTSLSRLKTCDEKLQTLFNVVIQYFDCTIIQGNRSKEAQNEYYLKGLSKLKYPFSKHNTDPSIAVDVAPYLQTGLSFDKDQCYYFGGFVKGIAKMLNIKIRWGGDWDSDNDVTDQTFNDLVHFELIED